MITGFCLFLLRNDAESEGFEPSIQFPVYTLSKRAPSATRTTLHYKNSGKQMYGLSFSLKNQSNTFSISMLRDPFTNICAFW